MTYNVDVVKEDVVLHGPNLKTDSSHGLKVGWSLLLKVGWVLDLPWCPNTLVGWVVNERSGPFALVSWVLNGWLLPWSTSGDFFALGVGDGWCDPCSILIIFPIFWLNRLWVRDGSWLINKPVLGNSRVFVDNLEWRILIPVLWLSSLRISDSGLINPGIWLGVLRVINLLWWVECGSEVLKKVCLLDLLTVLLDNDGVVGVNNQGVKLRGLHDTGGGRASQMLLLIIAGLWVLVVDDQVYLVCGTALVGSEHDDVWGNVGELILVKSLVITEKLHVSTTTLETT